MFYEAETSKDIFKKSKTLKYNQYKPVQLERNVTTNPDVDYFSVCHRLLREEFRL